MVTAEEHGGDQVARVALRGAPNPGWARHALDRLAQQHPDAVDRLADDEALAHRYAVVTGASEALGDLLAVRPGLLDVLAEDPPAWGTGDVVAAATAAIGAVAEPGSTDIAVSEALAGVQRAGLLRVAARDMLGLTDTAGTADELADLADGMITAAHTHLDPDAGLLVMAMGKLGGQELNYVSDVDVIFVHEGDTTAAERLARNILALLGTHTSRGRVYEMDANLRPEGRNGPLTRSIDSYRAYYEQWARTWEFQALLKARPVVGPESLADAFTDLVRPLVWPERLGADAVSEIQAMKRRVEESRPVVRDGSRQLKLAPGGLRDIEFAVQLLQLVHGPADPSLRRRGTVPALRALARGGYIDDGDAALFTDAYMFLRTVEHRLQLRQLRRTHTIPDDPEDVQLLARAMGFRDLPVRSAAEEFTAELSRVRAGVRRLHEQLFYRPLLSTLASYGVEQRVGGGARFDADAAEQRLRALSFTAPGKALRNLQALATGSSRTARQLRVVLPTMLEAMADQPDPDGGLTALRTMVDRLADNPRFVRTIRDHPPAARLLARVLGASPRLGEWLARQPEVLDLLDDEEALAAPRTRPDIVGAAEGLLRRGGGHLSADALRRFKRREALRTALRDITGAADVAQVGQELTWLGEGLLHATVSAMVPDEVRVAVIGMGRFGAAELGHASDLDVLFVHDGPTAVAEHACEEVLEFLHGITPEGSAFRIDPGLRPEGRSGPLSRSLESYTTYYDRWGSDWELQALTQARPVAGDAELAAEFMAAVEQRVFVTPVPEERLRSVRQMKARIEAERAGRTGLNPASSPRRRFGRAVRAGAHRTAAGPRAAAGRADLAASDDLKLGPGGLSDVEWTVQLLLLREGGADASLRGPGTLPGLDRLADAKLLTTEEAAWLRSGWRLLSAVRNALYLIGERDTATLPRHGDTVHRLAAMLGHDGAQQLTEDIDRARRRIRKVFDRRFF